MLFEFGGVDSKYFLIDLFFDSRDFYKFLKFALRKQFVYLKRLCRLFNCLKEFKNHFTVFALLL